LLHTDNLSVTIGNVRVCNDLGLAMQAGENWAILGPNGCGKTTLLLTLAGLHAPSRGAVRLGDRPVLQILRRERARLLGVLFQDAEDTFPTSVMETVLMGRHPHLSRWQWESNADIDIATTALNDVDLADFELRQLNTLSGGERRRASIATLLAQNPPICLLDEPTNHLDLHHQIQILDLLTQRTKRPGHLNVFVLHDINLAIRYCAYGLLLLGNGECRHGKLSQIINSQILEHLYGCPIREVRDQGGPLYIPA